MSKLVNSSDRKKPELRSNKGFLHTHRPTGKSRTCGENRTAKQTFTI
ncbi:MAG: hypothetical protein ACFBSE_22750 [Prochloraceae cyanobacterium]